jgi:hypothetical protein
MSYLLHVDVIEDDLRLPSSNLLIDCMCSRAISRALGQPVRVGIYSVRLPDNVGVIATLPPMVSDHVKAWLSGQTVEPFSFDVEVKQESLNAKACAS